MALYRLEAKIIGRKSKRSVVAAAAYQSGSVLYKAAYRSGTELTDSRSGQTFNYRPRAQEVLHTEIMAPDHGPGWLQRYPQDTLRQRALRENLWNTIERIEKRKDSQLAREFIVALPKELTLEQQVALVRGWCDAEFIHNGLVVDFAIHKSKSGRNPHAHILTTLRPVEGNGFGKKPSTAGKFNGRGWVGMGAKADLEAWRVSWASHANVALANAGRTERVDHRSLQDRGIDRIPEPKLGPAATAMIRRGLDPERFQLLRFVRALNDAKIFSRAIGRFKEIHQHGMGRSWWERSLLFMAHAREAVRQTVHDTRHMLTQSHLHHASHLQSTHGQSGPAL